MYIDGLELHVGEGFYESEKKHLKSLEIPTDQTACLTVQRESEEIEEMRKEDVGCRDALHLKVTINFAVFFPFLFLKSKLSESLKFKNFFDF